MKAKLALTALAGLAASSAPGADGPTAGGGTCTRAAAGSAGIAVRTARAGLMAIPPEDADTSVAPSTGERIEAVKDRLRVFVQAMMACAPASVEPAALAAAMAQRGNASAAIASNHADPPELDRHGDWLTYEVSRVEAHPDMLAVVATLGIRCGSDSILMLYRREGTRWRELMVRRALPYKEASGGWQDLRFAVSPPGGDGRWFVATVSTTPWCSSSWQGLRYALARPAEDPGRPNVFLDEKTTTWLGSEEERLVRAERDSFELRHVAGSIDPAVHNRRHVRRYAVSGNSARRVPPVAESLRDFVDEWIVSPWTEAKGWSGQDPELVRIHARLHSDRYPLLGEYASIRACGGGLTQIEIGSDEGPGWFFRARGDVDGPWTLERVARRGSADCSGPNRLRKE
jgi:hypothetical protein